MDIEPIVTKGGKLRFQLQGLNHPRGEPIRFKSIESVKRHLANVGFRPMLPLPKKAGRKKTRKR